MIEAVVFDMDGVIVDSEHLWGESWSSFAAQHGRAWTDDDSTGLSEAISANYRRVLADAGIGPADLSELRVVCFEVSSDPLVHPCPVDGVRRVDQESLH